MPNKRISDITTTTSVDNPDLFEMSQFNGLTYDSRSVSVSTLRDGLYVFIVEQFVLDGTDITNAFVILASEPVDDNSVDLKVHGAGEQVKDTDWEVDGIDPNKISWSGLALDGVLSSGDIISIHYISA